MISFSGACRHKVKEFPSRKLFLKPTTLTLQAHKKTAILVPDDADIVPLIRVFTGQLRLSEGKIYRTSTVSPPVGKLANVSSRLSPYEAIRYASKLYDVEFSKMMTALLLLTDIQDYLDEPLSAIPNLYKNRFNHALWLSIQFDTYIYMQNLDIKADVEYCDKLKIFRERVLSNCGLLLFTSNASTAESYCDEGVVFHDKTLLPFKDLGKAIEFFNDE